MGGKIRFLAVAFVLCCLSGAASADKNIAHSKSLGMSFVAKGEPWCQKQVQVQIEGNDASKFSTDAFKTIIKKLGVVLHSECPQASALQLTGNVDGAVVWVGNATKRSGWNVRALSLKTKKYPVVKKPRKEDPRIRAREYFQYKKDFAAEKPVPGHDLSSYGYYKSRKIAEEGHTTLYVAGKTPRDDLFEFVMLHDPDKENTPMFDTLSPDHNRAIRVMPEFYQMLTRMLSGTPVVQHRILHHLKGYHHPKDDRLKVLGPHYSETPLMITQFREEWNNGLLVISEHDRYPFIGYEPEHNYPLRRDWAIVNLGPSAPEEGLIEDEPVVALGPEGPSDEYLAKQQARRDDLIAKGFIYKNESYWSQFATADIRSIFEGEWYGSRGYLGNAALLHFLSANSEHCLSSIESPRRFRLIEYTTRTDESGFSSTSQQDVWNMVVPERFHTVLSAMFKDVNKLPEGSNVFQAAMEMLKTPLSRQIRDYTEKVKSVEDMKLDVGKIVALEGCTGPVKRQMEEMLYHYAALQNPKVHSKLRFNNASSLSDKLYVPGEAKNIKTACLAAGDFAAWDQKKRDYCACVQAVMERNAPDRLEKYSKRYRQLTADFYAAKLAVERGMDHPDIKVFGNLRSTCVKM